MGVKLCGWASHLLAEVITEPRGGEFFEQDVSQQSLPSAFDVFPSGWPDDALEGVEKFCLIGVSQGFQSLDSIGCFVLTAGKIQKTVSDENGLLSGASYESERI